MTLKMKKIFYAIMGGVLLLLAGCTQKGEVFYQNPYRIIVGYLPQTVTIDGISGTVTPDANYDWITSNGNGSFTLRRNTSGLIRRAEFTISGSKDKAVVSQRAHALDAAVTAKLVGQGLGTADVNVTLASGFPDDYASWGLIYSTDNKMENGKDVPQSGVPTIGDNLGELTGLAEGTDYIIWAYVVSTEGDKVFSSPVGLVPPVFVKAGENLQAAIDNAKEFAEVRVQGGAVFNGTILFDGKNKNKSVSGGWNADFSEQSWNNLTVIDGGGANRGIYCGDSPISDMPLQGYVNISYFEIRNCLALSGHGAGLRISGGPVTVHHCWFHDNKADRGAAFSTREDDQSSDLTVYDCVITNNYADGHGGAFSIEDGQSRANPTKAVIVGNVIANNRSIKDSGYAGCFYIYQSVNVQFLNNTIVNHVTWHYDENWPNFYMRGNTNAVLANNMFLRNWYSDGGDNYTPDNRPIQFNDNRVTFHTNYVEAQSNGGDGKALITDETFFAPGFDITSVLKNPDKNVPFTYSSISDYVGENYMSKGAAVGAGCLETLSYNSFDTANLGQDNKADIKAVLEGFGADINGTPFVRNGKVDIGAVQSK